MYSMTMRNYPNPFNPQTVITVDVPKDGNVAVLIYDSAGRLISKVYDDIVHAGKVDVNFDGSHLAGGMYYAVAKTQDTLAVCKMSLVK
jgi:hypothetical protein